MSRGFLFALNGRDEFQRVPFVMREVWDTVERVPAKQKFMSEKHEGFMKALKCRECGREYPLEATHVCEFDFGPLEVVYDYDRIKKAMTRSAIESRPQTM